MAKSEKECAIRTHTLWTRFWACDKVKSQVVAAAAAAAAGVECVVVEDVAMVM